MPGVDGHGPRGLGPMTGRGMGQCAIVASRFGFGMGRGLGRGMGRGRGMGWRRPGVQAIGGGFPAASSELGALQEDAAALEAELQRIRQRIAELS